MGKTDDKPWYSWVSYFCWTDPTRLDLFICVAIFASDMDQQVVVVYSIPYLMDIVSHRIHGAGIYANIKGVY